MAEDARLSIARDDPQGVLSSVASRSQTNPGTTTCIQDGSDAE
jgi:hypothetical protein